MLLSFRFAAREGASDSRHGRTVHRCSSCVWGAGPTVSPYARIITGTCVWRCGAGNRGIQMGKCRRGHAKGRPTAAYIRGSNCAQMDCLRARARQGHSWPAGQCWRRSMRQHGPSPKLAHPVSSTIVVRTVVSSLVVANCRRVRCHTASSSLQLRPHLPHCTGAEQADSSSCTLYFPSDGSHYRPKHTMKRAEHEALASSLSLAALPPDVLLKIFG